MRGESVPMLKGCIRLDHSICWYVGSIDQRKSQFLGIVFPWQRVLSTL